MSSIRPEASLRSGGGGALWPLLLVAFAAQAVAAEQDPADASLAEPPLVGNIEDFDLEDLLDLDIVVTSASGRKQRLLEVPATVSVLSREDIRASGARTIPDLLLRIPGVQVFQSAPGVYSLSLRGMGGLQDNNVVVLVNGVAANSKLNGSLDWAGLPVHIDEIERVEVVRGPVSTIYGANAYTGVIDIITDRKVEGVQAWAGLAGGAELGRGFGFGDAHAQLLGSAMSGGLSFGLAAHARNDDRSRQAPAAGTVSPGAATSLGGNSWFDFAVGDSVSLTGRLQAARASRSALNNLVVQPVQDTHSLLLGALGLEVRELSSVLKSAKVWAHGQTDRISRADGDLVSGFSLDGTSAEDLVGGVDTHLDLPGDLLVDLGGEAGVTRVAAPFLLPEESGKTRPSYALHGSAERRLGRALLASAGVRLDANSLSRTRASYRVSANYRASIFGARLTAAHGFRNPTYIEVAGRFIDPDLNIILLEGSSALQPQSISSLELALILVPKQGLVINPVIYAFQLDQVISEDFEPVTRKTFSNLNTARRMPFSDLVGAEIEAWYDLRRSLRPRVAISVLWWPWRELARAATVGLPSNNSTLTFSAGIRGELLERRLGYGLNVDFASARAYGVRAGVPPSIISRSVPPRTRIDATTDYRVVTELPLWVTLRAQSTIPDGLLDSPFPAAGTLGSSLMLGLDYRGK